jgi:glycosyltransferase involved in cell wall biosynthesis
MKLSLVMPVYSGIGTIAEIIGRVLEAAVQISKELIVVDDCSTGGTREDLGDFLEGPGSGLERVELMD